MTPDWAQWMPLWEHAVIRLAAVCLAAGVVWRYVIVPLFRAIRSFIRGAKSLTQEVEQVRALVASQHKLVYRELNTNGGSSLVDKVNHLTETVGDVKRDQERLSGSIVAYVFTHKAEHAQEWDYLREEYGLDRRDPPPP